MDGIGFNSYYLWRRVMRKSVLLTLLSFCYCIGIGIFNTALAFDAPPYAITHQNTHTAELKPIPNSYLLAKTTFLPDRFEDLGLSDYDTMDGDYNINNCDAYPLTSCPTNAFCLTCPINPRRYKLNSCKNGFTVSNNSCVAANCATAGYSATIPLNQTCTQITVGNLTCYKNCRTVSCSGYTSSCSNKPNHAATMAKCPDCTSNTANCGDNVCKISQCNDGYKIANNATSCIELNNTCPEGYFKTCETDIETSVEPVTTEAGEKCYKCKVVNDSCPEGYYKTCENGTIGEPTLTEAGNKCYKCAIKADPECYQFKTDNVKNYLRKDIVCTDTINLGVSSINGGGHTIKFVFEDGVKSSFSFSPDANNSKIKDINILVESDARLTGNAFGYSAGIVQFHGYPGNDKTLNFENVNISTNLSANFNGGFQFISGHNIGDVLKFDKYPNIKFSGKNTLSDKTYQLGIQYAKQLILAPYAELNLTGAILAIDDFIMQKNSALNINNNTNISLIANNYNLSFATLNIESGKDGLSWAEDFTANNSVINIAARETLLENSENTASFSFNNSKLNGAGTSTGTTADIVIDNITLNGNSFMNLKNVRIVNDYTHPDPKIELHDSSQLNILNGEARSVEVFDNAQFNIKSNQNYECINHSLFVHSRDAVINMDCKKYFLQGEFDWSTGTGEPVIDGDYAEITLMNETTISNPKKSYRCDFTTSCLLSGTEDFSLLNYYIKNDNVRPGLGRPFPTSFNQIFNQVIFTKY